MEGFDFNFSIDKFKKIVVNNLYANEWYEAVCLILPDYEINTVNRVAAFLSQTAHETGDYRAIKENLNYRAETLHKIWKSHFPTMEIAYKYEKKPVMIANRAYADRMGNGNEASGDGYKFCGRGLIQLTGKENYTRYADSLEISLDEASEHLTTFEGCVQSACWFWEENKLNQYADKGNTLAITKIINGGTIGLADRELRYKHAIEILRG